MSLKRWVLGKVNGTNARPRVAPSLHGAAVPLPEAREPTVGRAAERDGRREAIAHLGPYAALIGAIREALEHFAASQLRLHLAIAERDRYVLTSIEVECDGTDEQRALLRRFVAEFRPEQIKQYLAREVIAGLRNASAIDLKQFAGLNAARDAQAEEALEAEEDPYEDLLADLRGGSPGTHSPAFEVTLVGRWAPADAPLFAQGEGRAGPQAPRKSHDVQTPLAARALALDVEDAAGARRVELESVVPGRRYVIGKDPGCDIVVDGVYASRRHCELWFDERAWWVIDAGSTNGVRVEATGRVARSDPDAGDRAQPIELPAGAALILSAHARGHAGEYPRLVARPGVVPERDAAMASKDAASPPTPIAPPRARQVSLTVAAHMSSGVREAELVEGALPFLVGRSRNQGLVIDWGHAEVSGRHLEIVAIDEAGAAVVVHGDNGVRVGATAYRSGEQFSWKPGETLLLGRGDATASSCTLTLARTP